MPSIKVETVLAAKGPRVVTITPGATIQQAMRALANENIGALVVVGDDRKPLGIISERDIIRALASDRSVFEQRVEDVMTAEVFSGSPGDDVESVLHTMTEGHFRHLPIVDGGELAGLVTTGDLVRAQLNAYRGAAETLETQLLQS
jgi:CBS domain-containing protein